MDLGTYLLKHDLTQAAFAERLGVTPGLVWQWLHGRTNFTPDRVVAIERATNGEVSRRDLWPEMHQTTEEGPA